MIKVKIFDWIYRFLLIIMVVMLVIMVVTVSINVITRYFGKGILWVEEISNLSFVWMSFLAMAIGWQFNMHPGFELVKKKGIVFRFFQYVNLFLVLIFLLYAFKGGWDYTRQIANQKTPILGISVAWKYAAVSFATFFMIVETIHKIINLTHKNRFNSIAVPEGGDRK
jgi:TRAP-type C4-dicarboxylate transport system permease small subunit